MKTVWALQDASMAIGSSETIRVLSNWGTSRDGIGIRVTFLPEREGACILGSRTEDHSMTGNWCTAGATVSPEGAVTALPSIPSLATGSPWSLSVTDETRAETGAVSCGLTLGAGSQSLVLPSVSGTSPARFEVSGGTEAKDSSSATFHRSFLNHAEMYHPHS